MPILSNPKHEAFAQGLAKGLKATEAYQEAGFKTTNPQSAWAAASRLLRDVMVLTRKAELQGKVAETSETTLAELVADAKMIQKAAYEANQFGAANGALKLRSELTGHYVRKTEDVTPARHRQDVDARILELITEYRKDETAEAPTGPTAH